MDDLNVFFTRLWEYFANSFEVVMVLIVFLSFHIVVLPKIKAYFGRVINLFYMLVACWSLSDFSKCIYFLQDAYRLQLKLFLYEVKQQQLLSGVRTFLKVYSTISLGKLANYMEVDEPTLRYFMRSSVLAQNLSFCVIICKCDILSFFLLCLAGLSWWHTSIRHMLLMVMGKLYPMLTWISTLTMYACLFPSVIF